MVLSLRNVVRCRACHIETISKPHDDCVKERAEVEANTISYNAEEPAYRSNGGGEADKKGAKLKANTERFGFR